MRESETLELKKSTGELKDALKSISAILNKHQNGELFFGVTNSGRILGQTVNTETLRKVSMAVANKIEPKIYPRINKVSIEGKSCIHVEFKGNNVPYYADGRAYMRVADEDRLLSAKELEKLILDKNKDKMKWDKEICKKASLSDINQKKLRWFLKTAGLRSDSVENSLEKLGLIVDGKIRNTAVILFGKNPEKFFPNATLRCAVFGTKDTSVTIDMQNFVGDLFTLIEKAEKYILENIHVGMKLEGMRRINVPEIERDAFRESIINAFCHRNYYEHDSVTIAIFRDRLEIRSPGTLYGGLTVERIRQEDISKRRNELLAEMFHRVHFVERWGRGIRKILTKEPSTDFRIVAGMFYVVFRRKGVTTVEPGLVERLVEGLVENQRKIVLLIIKNPAISKREMAERLGISTTAVDKNIASLRKKRIIKRVGAAKGGYWEIIRS